MERAVWLEQMQAKLEALYDHLAPGYWVRFGTYANETHLAFIDKFLARMPAHGMLLSAACGAGRYDGLLLEAGHLGQNVYLAGTSMKLGVCAVGAFLDDGLNNLLGVDGQNEAAIYLLAVGKL